MIPSAFNEENIVFNPPPGVSSEDCLTISAWRGVLTNGLPAVISCWKPTKEELEEIARTGRVWVVIWGTVMPPIHLSGVSPFHIHSDP